jgi:hypothetical protein
MMSYTNAQYSSTISFDNHDNLWPPLVDLKMEQYRNPEISSWNRVSCSRENASEGRPSCALVGLALESSGQVVSVARELTLGIDGNLLQTRLASRS